MSKTNKAVRFKIREIHILKEKNDRKPITRLCLVSESQDGCGFLRPLPGFVQISKSWLCSIKVFRDVSGKKEFRVAVGGGVALHTVCPFGFSLSNEWTQLYKFISNVKNQNQLSKF